MKYYVFVRNFVFCCCLLTLNISVVYGQEIQLVKYQFTNSNTNPDANPIGSPNLTLSGLNYSGSYGNPFSSLYTNTDGRIIELTISTLGYENIKVEWDGGFFFGNNNRTHQWQLQVDSGSGYGTVIYTQTCSGSWVSIPAQNLSNSFNNKASIKIRITSNVSNNRYVYIDNLIVKGAPNDDEPPVIVATGDQGFCDGDPALNVVESISITDPDPSDTQLDAMSVQISSGYVNGEDVLSIIGSHPNIADSWDTTTGRLTLTGPATFVEFESAISSVQYTNASGTPTYGARIFSITLEQANFLSESNHFYEFISDVGIRWDDARDAAAARTYYGLQGYLATLSSQAESDLAGAQISGAGWLGGSDEDVEGVWKWMTGPEVGTVFWNGLAGGSSPSWAFWNTGEPNNVGSGGEDYAHITDNTVGIPGSWNDLPIAGGGGAYQPKGYVVEYGGTTGDPVLQISATTSITVGITPIPVGLFHD
tara:strand:- start:2082 stop:3515 length:1434 start_codon:yes stop_codon:yes gene_type:complete